MFWGLYMGLFCAFLYGLAQPGMDFWIHLVFLGDKILHKQMLEMKWNEIPIILKSFPNVSIVVV